MNFGSFGGFGHLGNNILGQLINQGTPFVRRNTFALHNFYYDLYKTCRIYISFLAIFLEEKPKPTPPPPENEIAEAEDGDEEAQSIDFSDNLIGGIISAIWPHASEYIQSEVLNSGRVVKLRIRAYPRKSKANL